MQLRDRSQDYAARSETRLSGGIVGENLERVVNAFDERARHACRVIRRYGHRACGLRLSSCQKQASPGLYNRRQNGAAW